MKNYNTTLTNGSLLKSTKHLYKIEQMLGQGAFGVTYLACVINEEECSGRFCIKEFFMNGLNTRSEDGKVSKATYGDIVQKYAERFRVEAKNLSRLRHKNIVKILDFIEANNTYYYVMNLIEGMSLDDYIKSHGPLDESNAATCIGAIASALYYMHSNKMLHLDLKPKNIMLRNEDGVAILVDFGLSKQYTDEGEPESSTSIGLGTPGYAPLEQASAKSCTEFQPTLDIYAFGATLYKMLTGMTPPDASEVYNDGVPTDNLISKGISKRFVDTILKSMEPKKRDRIQTINEFAESLGIELDVDNEEENKSFVIGPVNVAQTVSNSTKDEETQVVLDEEETQVNNDYRCSSFDNMLHQLGTQCKNINQNTYSFEWNGILFTLNCIDNGNKVRLTSENFINALHVGTAQIPFSNIIGDETYEDISRVVEIYNEKKKMTSYGEYKIVVDKENCCSIYADILLDDVEDMLHTPHAFECFMNQHVIKNTIYDIANFIINKLQLYENCNDGSGRQSVSSILKLIGKKIKQEPEYGVMVVEEDKEPVWIYYQDIDKRFNTIAVSLRVRVYVEYDKSITRTSAMITSNACTPLNSSAHLIIDSHMAEHCFALPIGADNKAEILRNEIKRIVSVGKRYCEKIQQTYKLDIDESYLELINNARITKNNIVVS